ncbi:MAG: hypothetical protein JSU65_05520 [Candidatus Zixiibacteriota bacterium]|nr:MAG: hypothetical protein JSU65_05520 [candidate division Zixibacteria bacterium]
MMDFFAAVAVNLRNRYLTLAHLDQHQNIPSRETGPTEPEQTAEPEPVDSYVPTAALPDTTDLKPYSEPEVETQDAGADEPDSEPPAIGQNPDGTYYRRDARLAFNLDLRFDLGAFTTTVTRLAEGATGVIDEFTAVGFGLQADFAVKGKQTVDTNMTEGATALPRHFLTVDSGKAKQLGSFQATNGAFQVESFYRQAARVRRMLDVKEHDGHRRAVSKFAFRMHIDNRFNIAFANRFNVQTQRMSEELPDQVGSYLDNAGDVAAKGTDEMMATFFDAVDGYLDRTEENLLESVVGAFDKAAAELGFSGPQTDLAREQLTDSIESFFNRVATGLDRIKSRFVPSAVEAPGDSASPISAGYEIPAGTTTSGQLYGDWQPAEQISVSG